MPSETLDLLRAGKLHGIHRLDLSAGLTKFPEEIYDLADTLEILNLSDNQLDNLPVDLPRLKNLRILFCSGNRFRHLPEILGQCPSLEMVGFKANQIETVSAAALPSNLRWLVLTDNRIAQLPPEIGRCKRLQKLMLSGNLLTTLPAEMAGLGGLELIRLAANRFETLPDFIQFLPRLAWLAFAGNPCAPAPESSVETIDWDRIELREKLGEGASGTIFKAVWHPENSPSPQDVAVKLFKGSMTSDGLPENEIAACLAAGHHENLIDAFGKITGHPDGVEGMVMPLVDPDFTNLAGPPSLKSCTQDIYPQDRHFPLPVAKKIAASIAGAAAQLHARRINHGDLYAHNILWTPQGDCRLGDFGAASFYPPSAGDSFEKIEVRAFGHLLGELVARVISNPATEAEIEELLALKDHCLCPAPEFRPTFKDIGFTLSF